MSNNPLKGNDCRKVAVKQRPCTCDPQIQVCMKRDANKGMFVDDKEDQTYIKNIKFLIEYIQKNVAALTLIVTTGITVGGILLKYIYYLIELGYTKYFNIYSLHIDISDDNILYSIVANGVFAVLLFMISALPYWIAKSKWTKFSKILTIVLITLIPDGIMSISFIWLANRGIIYKCGEYIFSLGIGILLGLCLFSIGYFSLIDEYFRNKRLAKNIRHESETNLIRYLKRFAIAVALLVTLESVLLLGIGYYKAASQNQFRIIETIQDDYYVVLYETDNNYIISKCEIKEDKILINRKEQKEISKENVDYSIKRLVQTRE